MHKLMIHRLGPIRHCELEIGCNMALTGNQAAGKSTIAKAVYFFRTLKEDIAALAARRAFGPAGDARERMTTAFERLVRNKFLDTFGSSYKMERDMCMTYAFSDAVEVSVSLAESNDFSAPNFVFVNYSPALRSFLLDETGADAETLRAKLAALFDDAYETVYIPAGRSVLTVLGGPFNYFYSTMDDAQKRLLDTCTRNYLERVLRLRPQFAEGLRGLSEGRRMTGREAALHEEALSLISQILKGEYRVADGEDRIGLADGRYVKINYASSGQQESVWILNLLYYYFAMKHPVFFIIEEPESNLFPSSQKLMVELIALIADAGHRFLVTTHSPYVLGELGNLLYASFLGRENPEGARSVIAESKWLSEAEFDAFFVRDGGIEDCLDRDLHQIDHTRLDEISGVINEEYDRLLSLESPDAEAD